MGLLGRLRCDGSGLCAEVFPEMIQLDDWGYPIVAPGAIPVHLMRVRPPLSRRPAARLRQR